VLKSTKGKIIFLSLSCIFGKCSSCLYGVGAGSQWVDVVDVVTMAQIWSIQTDWQLCTAIRPRGTTGHQLGAALLYIPGSRADHAAYTAEFYPCVLAFSTCGTALVMNSSWAGWQADDGELSFRCDICLLHAWVIYLLNRRDFVSTYRQARNRYDRKNCRCVFLIVYQRRDKGDDYPFILSARGDGTVPFTTADSNHVFRYESAEWLRERTIRTGTYYV